MSNAELLTTTTEVIRNVVNNKNLEVKLESKLIGDLGLESIDLLDVSSELENTLGWELDFREIADSISKSSGKEVSMKNIRVQDLIDYINVKNSN
jgi:acyl carrier protein